MSLELSLEELAENVYHVQFATQLEITSTLLRPQEHFESPEFRGKIFTFDEFKEWYIKNSPRGKETGEFTYFSDWNSFNFPSTVLKPFYRGDFDPITDKEGQFLKLFEGKSEPFYVIGTHREKPLKIRNSIRHELGHALFLTSPEYKSDVLEVLNGMNQSHRQEVIGYLESTGGYHQDVIVDETHAHLLASLAKLQEKGDIEVQKFAEVSGQLNAIFDKYFKPKNNIL